MMPVQVSRRKCTCSEKTAADRARTDCNENCEAILHRRNPVNDRQAAKTSMAQELSRSPGQPLDSGTRAALEPHFGFDFSRVRVHTGPGAAESAKAENALAYTLGRDIVFGASQYAPHTLSGKALLAHELTHVVQQEGSDSIGVQRAEDKGGGSSQPGGDTASSSSASNGDDADIKALDLTSKADTAAKKLKKDHPSVIFTSGRRDVAGQAKAMADLIAGPPFDRNRIHNTYLGADKLQKWVDNHPKAKTTDDIAEGLEETMNAMTETERSKVSKHLTGEAFDVQPVEGKDGEKIKADMQTLPGKTKFLDKEGGLTRWHVQFKVAKTSEPVHDHLEQEADQMADRVARAENMHT